MPTAQAILKRIAILALTVGAGAGPTAELADIPEEVLEGLLVPESLAGVDDTDRASLIVALAKDPRESVRQSAAASIATLQVFVVGKLETTLERLASDPAWTVRRALAASLGPALARLPALDRAYLVNSWAASDSPAQRWAIATALTWPFEVLGARSALAHLANDPNREIRAAALRARNARQVA